MRKILTDKECKDIWNDSSATKPLKLDEIGLQVMKWLEKQNGNMTKVHNHKHGIN